MTEGEIRVVRQFNPSESGQVNDVKIRAAALIDKMLALSGHRNEPHVRRWAALAATAFEEGAMYAVKALTHEDH